MNTQFSFVTQPIHAALSYFLLAFIAMAGLSYLNFLPAVMNALAGGIGFTEIEAGQIVATNGYGALVGSLIAIFLVRKVRWQWVTLSCLGLLICLDVSTAWLKLDADSAYRTVLGLRFAAGIAGGLSLGLAFAMLARLHQPDRAFGTLLFLQFSIGSLVIYLLPALEALTTPHAVFYLMAAISLLALIMICYFPRLALRSADNSHLPLNVVVQQSKAAPVLLLSAILLYQMAASGIWAYVGLIGSGAGIDTQTVNVAIASTGLLGLAGALLAVVTGHRFGRLGWLLAGTSLSVFGTLLLHFSAQPLWYVSAMAMLFLAWPAVLSYLLAVIAELDGSGRLATLASLISSVGMASGPLLGATLLRNDNYQLLLQSCIGLFLLSFLLLFRPVRTQDKIAVAQANR